MFMEVNKTLKLITTVDLTAFPKALEKISCFSQEPNLDF
jgi:hypothetical protein